MSNSGASNTGAAGDVLPALAIPVRRFAVWAWSLTGIVYCLGLIAMILVLTLKIRSDKLGLQLIHLNAEHGLPAWYSSLGLAGTAFLLLLVSRASRHAGDRDYFRWALLAVIFILMSLDELAEIHEKANQVLGDMTRFAGIFYFSWVIIAIPLVIAVGLYFLPFVLRLRRDTRWRIILAGCIYVGGALGMEILGGGLLAAKTDNVWPGLVILAEEGGEFAGMTFFLTTLVRHLALTSPEIVLRFVRGSGA